jgi:predicted CopG family antitoxin
MSSKTISLKEETYERLRREKGDDESFSDVIDRFLSEEEHPLYGLVGLATDDEVARIRAASRSFRADVDERMDTERQTEQ